MKNIKTLFFLSLVLFFICGCNGKNNSYNLSEVKSDLEQIKNNLEEVNSDMKDMKNEIFEIKKDININSKESELDDYSIAVRDYPLIDVEIRYNKADIKLIIANNVLVPEISEYLFTNDKEILEKMQSVLEVTTFPKGHGTTPDSYIYVYQDNELIKEIPFSGVFENSEKFNLMTISKEEVEKIIEQPLPLAL